jgi:hypothetical protein
MVQFLSLPYLSFPQWRAVIGLCQPNKLFLPNLLWSWCFITAMHSKLKQKMVPESGLLLWQTKPCCLWGGRVEDEFGTLGWKKHWALGGGGAGGHPVGAWKIRVLREMQRMEVWPVRFQRETKIP